MTQNFWTQLKQQVSCAGTAQGGAGTRGVGRRLLADKAGSVAVAFALLVPILIMLAGGAVDYSRAINARYHAQDAIDAAALAAASSKATSQDALKAIAREFLEENVTYEHLELPADFTVDYLADDSGAKITVDLTGRAPTLFLGIIGLDSLPVHVHSTALRGAAKDVELALVLDNTWSMSDADSSGTVKITALKAAAKNLIDAIMQNGANTVRVGIVPYADYVNVGVANRSKGWVSVPADYSVSTPQTCTTKTTKQQCTKGEPKTCTRVVDGVSETYNCTPNSCVDVEVAPYQSCSGGGTSNYRWFGCVGSRKEGSFRLNDLDPSKQYPGYLSTSQRCLNPIQPLIADKAKLLSVVNGLIVNIGGYKPYTYIPAGLIWGVNVLSPTEPMSEAGAYDEENQDPRKVLVLMTDGENTLRFDPSASSTTPNHPGFSSNGNTAAVQLKATNDDAAAICEYAKSKKIEVFTVALGVKDATAKSLLESCASGKDHYFDAANTADLALAFADIAASLNNVRLVK